MIVGEIEQAKTREVVVVLFVGEQVEERVGLVLARKDLEWTHDGRFCLRGRLGHWRRECHGDKLANAELDSVVVHVRQEVHIGVGRLMELRQLKERQLRGDDAFDDVTGRSRGLEVLVAIKWEVKWRIDAVDELMGSAVDVGMDGRIDDPHGNPGDGVESDVFVVSSAEQEDLRVAEDLFVDAFHGGLVTVRQCVRSFGTDHG